MLPRLHGLWKDSDCGRGTCFGWIGFDERRLQKSIRNRQRWPRLYLSVKHTGSMVIGAWQLVGPNSSLVGVQRHKCGIEARLDYRRKIRWGSIRRTWRDARPERSVYPVHRKHGNTIINCTSCVGKATQWNHETHPFNTGIIILQVDAYFDEINVRIDMLEIHLHKKRSVMKMPAPRKVASSRYWADICLVLEKRARHCFDDQKASLYI